jgi:DNA-binding phage protein
MSRIYKSYNFIDKDPIIDEIRTVMQDEGVSHTYIEEVSGVTTQTLRNWFDGKTRRPQFATVKAVVRAMGYDVGLVRATEARSPQKTVRKGKVVRINFTRPRARHGRTV